MRTRNTLNLKIVNSPNNLEMLTKEILISQDLFVKVRDVFDGLPIQPLVHR